MARERKIDLIEFIENRWIRKKDGWEVRPFPFGEAHICAQNMGPNYDYSEVRRGADLQRIWNLVNAYSITEENIRGAGRVISISYYRI